MKLTIDLPTIFEGLARNVPGIATEAAAAALEVVRAELPAHVNSTTSRGREPYASTFRIRSELTAAVLWTDAPYSRVLEYGIHQYVQVRTHQRGNTTVRAHSKLMNLPPRHIIRRTVQASQARAVDAALGVFRRFWNAG